MQQPISPVTSLSLNDMIGARIKYVYTQHINGTPDMVETGIIQSVKQLGDGRLEMYVVPTNPSRMAKYRIAETHLLKYIHTEVSAQKLSA